MSSPPSLAVIAQTALSDFLRAEPRLHYLRNGFRTHQRQLGLLLGYFYSPHPDGRDAPLVDNLNAPLFSIHSYHPPHDPVFPHQHITTAFKRERSPVANRYEFTTILSRARQHQHRRNQPEHDYVLIPDEEVDAFLLHWLLLQIGQRLPVIADRQRFLDNTLPVPVSIYRLQSPISLPTPSSSKSRTSQASAATSDIDVSDYPLTLATLLAGLGISDRASPRFQRLCTFITGEATHPSLRFSENPNDTPWGKLIQLPNETLSPVALVKALLGSSSRLEPEDLLRRARYNVPAHQFYRVAFESSREDSSRSAILAYRFGLGLPTDSVLDHLQDSFFIGTFQIPASGMDALAIPPVFELLKSIGREQVRVASYLRLTQALQQDTVNSERKNRDTGIVGSSSAMQQVIAAITRVSRSDATVLITGESGTGKELVARAIHSLSPRASAPFVPVSIAALNPTVIESELFGHEKGGFTGAMAQKLGRFELAAGGTLLLDEIGELSTDIQVKLLRVLQERQIERVGGTKTVDVDIRIVAATNADLEQLVAQKAFRQDLYYRINVFRIPLPPLRERRDDIPALADHFIRHFATRNRMGIPAITPDALQALINYNWPGNVRELSNVIERAILVHDSPTTITLDNLQLNLGGSRLPPEHLSGVMPVRTAGTRNLMETMARLEAEEIRRALASNNGNKSATSRALGISREGLDKKIKRLGVER